MRLGRGILSVRRGILSVRGPDALHFLQGLTTADVRTLRNPNDAVFAAFLNPKGRTVAEATVSLSQSSKDGAPELLLDVPEGQVATLAAQLLRYKLRRNVDIRDLSDEHAVFALPSLHPFATSTDAERAALVETATRLRRAVQEGGPSSASAVYLDPRSPRLGLRLLAPSSCLAAVERAEPGLVAVQYPHFEMLRLLLGVPEGAEVVDAVPAEWNAEYLGAVSFGKGCYIGQELVARTHFRGAVRKRYVPLVLQAEGAAARSVLCADPVAAAASFAHVHPAALPFDAGSIHFPFPFVDAAWCGAAPHLGSTIAASRGSEGTPPDEEEDGAVEKAGTGKLVAWAAGSNVALGLLRLSWLPQPPSALAELPTGSEGSPPALDAVANDAAAQDYAALHRRCTEAGPCQLELRAPESAGSASARLTATPVLPMWWCHMSSRVLG
jgi:tRNA-modifying protein YgfZ